MERGAGEEGDGQRDAGPGHRGLPHRQLQGALHHPGEQNLRVHLPSPASGDVVQGTLLRGRENQGSATR